MKGTDSIIETVCGSVSLEGCTVPKSVRDSMRRCLDDEAVFDFAVVYIAGARAGYRNLHRTETDDVDPYCYRYSCTPVNRLNIRDYDTLMTKIRDVSALRLAEITAHPPLIEPGIGLLRDIHKALYGDIFSWAGEFRTADTDDPLVCRPDFIQSSCDGLMKELKGSSFLSAASKEELADGLAHYLCELHVMMPFRYGTDLTARTFANFVAMMNGFFLDYSKTCSSLMDIALKFAVSDESQMKDIIRGIITEY